MLLIKGYSNITLYTDLLYKWIFIITYLYKKMAVALFLQNGTLCTVTAVVSWSLEKLIA
jgi:hypothetical protein